MPHTDNDLLAMLAQINVGIPLADQQARDVISEVLHLRRYPKRAAELALEMAAEQDKLAERASPPLRQPARDRAEAYREVARRICAEGGIKDLA